MLFISPFILTLHCFPPSWLGLSIYTCAFLIYKNLVNVSSKFLQITWLRKSKFRGLLESKKVWWTSLLKRPWSSNQRTWDSFEQEIFWHFLLTLSNYSQDGKWLVSQCFLFFLGSSFWRNSYFFSYLRKKKWSHD